MTETVLGEIVALWEKVIERARLRKWEQFGKTADRAWAFVGKTYQDLYVDARDDPTERFAHVERGIWHTRRNLSRDYIATMLPYIHEKVPNRLVMPRRPGLPPDLFMLAQANPNIGPNLEYAAMLQKALEPVDAVRAHLLQWWLNYLPSENDLAGEERRALPEALVKGRCIAWTELGQGPHGLIPVTTCDTVDGLLCDPDARQWRDQGFIIRERRESVLRTAQKFSTAARAIDPGELRGRYNSQFHSAAQGANLLPRSGDATGDVCVYYEIFSRYGVGHHFDGAGDGLQKLRAALDNMPNVYLAIMPGLPHPLNLWPDALNVESLDDLKARLAWPIPFYADRTDPWPGVPCDFLPNANDPWATSPLEGCLPLLAFIDHAYCYMLDRVRKCSKTLFVGSKALGDQLRTLFCEALDLEYIVYDGNPSEDIDRLLKRVEFPEFRHDLLEIINKVEIAFAQASGMTAAMMGDAPEKQDRSAAATEAREQRLSSRPNDFAKCVETWNSKIASKEALATRLYVGKEVVMPLFGEQEIEIPDPSLDPSVVAVAEQTGQPVPTIKRYGPCTTFWLDLVSVGAEDMTQEELEQAAAEAAAELTYTVEAGSGRPKNRQKQVEDFKSLAEIVLPQVAPLAFQGNPLAIQSYNAIMALGGSVFERPMDAFILPNMPQEAQPDPEAEAEAQKTQQEAELEAAKARQESERADAEAAREEMHRQDVRAKREQAHAKRNQQRKRKQ